MMSVMRTCLLQRRRITRDESTITRYEYEQFLKLFEENDCTTMGDWLRVYNVADVVPFIEAFRKMAG